MSEKKLMKENLLKELPEMGKNLDAIRKGTNTELSADISMAEVVNERYGVSMDQYLSILGIDTKKIHCRTFSQCQISQFVG